MDRPALTLEQRVQRMEDVHEIANLKARYMNGADGGWDFNQIPSNPDEILPLFAEDGVWWSDSLGRAQGHEAIRAAWASFSGAMPFSVQTISNPLIEVDGDTATGQWHLAMKGITASGEEFWSSGLYEDEFVRTADGWRIKLTHPRLIFLGPYRDGFKSAVEATRAAATGAVPEDWKRMKG